MPGCTAGLGGLTVTPVMVTTELLTVKLNALVAFPTELFARTVKLYVPAVVGVPEIVPVLGLMVKPAGRAPEVISHVIGIDPVAVRK